MKDLVLAQNSCSNYVIVYPENASPSNITAAKELQKYLTQISGATLPIKTDIEAESVYEIAIGYTNRLARDADLEKRLGNDGFVIKTVGTKLFILGGGVRGALYGVYTFLEEYLGCRFYTSEYEKIPSNETISIPYIECDEQIPIFEHRRIDFVTSRKNYFQAKLKSNGYIGEAAYGGSVRYTGFVHTFNNLVPPSVYGESHPEYWGVNEDGTPQAHLGRQLCLTNPDVLQITKNSVRELLKNNPQTDIISISQNDGGVVELPCMCAKCREVYEEEGAYSGAIIRFVNAVANEFAEEYPNVKFDTLAYRYSRGVCKTRPADNVIVRLCTIECCFSHPLGTCQDVYKKPGTDTSISEDIVEWGKITKNVYIWDYVTNFAHPTVMFPNFNVLLPNVKFFADHNVNGIYEEGNFFSETGDFSDLRSYIMAKILWDPYMTEERYWAYIDEFLEDVYGEGWKYIREYIDIAQNTVKDRHFGIYYSPEQLYFNLVRKDDAKLPSDITLEKIRNYKTTDWTHYFNHYRELLDECELISRGEELFASALAVASDAQRARIEKIKLQLDFLKSYFMYYKFFRKERSIEILLERFFENDDEGKSLSAEDKKALSDAICQHIKEHILKDEREEYRKYNRALCEKALEKQVVQFREGRRQISSADEVIDFSKPALEWV